MKWFFSLILIFIYSTTFAGGWPISGVNYTRQRTITIDAAQVSDADTADFTNFPVAIVLTDDKYLGEVCQTDGDDVVFSVNGTTKLDHEVEKFFHYARDNFTSSNSDGFVDNAAVDVFAGDVVNAVFWVEVPTLDYDDDTTVTMYYGDDDGLAAAQEDENGTWDANYMAVYHFGETSGDTLHDSADFDDDGTTHDGTYTDYYHPTYKSEDFVSITDWTQDTCSGCTIEVSPAGSIHMVDPVTGSGWQHATNWMQYSYGGLSDEFTVTLTNLTLTNLPDSSQIDLFGDGMLDGQMEANAGYSVIEIGFEMAITGGYRRNPIFFLDDAAGAADVGEIWVAKDGATLARFERIYSGDLDIGGTASTFIFEYYDEEGQMFVSIKKDGGYIVGASGAGIPVGYTTKDSTQGKIELIAKGSAETNDYAEWYLEEFEITKEPHWVEGVDMDTSKIGGALCFYGGNATRGQSSGVTIPDHDDLDFTDVESLTIELWFTQQVDNDSMLIGKYGTGGYYYSRTSANPEYVYMFLQDNALLTLNGSTDIMNGFNFDWHYLAATKNISTGDAFSYLNGAQDDTVNDASVTTLANNGVLTIGGDIVGNRRYLFG